MRLSSIRPVRRGSVVVLAAAALALCPVVAHADDTPTPPTSSTAVARTPSSTTTTTTDPTGSSASSSGSSGTSSTTTSSSTTRSETSSSSTSTSGSPTAKVGESTKAKVASRVGVLAFAVPNLAAQAVAGVSPAANFLATTLAARGDHYDYPLTPGFPPYLDGGNTIDGALGLDAAGEGLDEAHNATNYLAAHLGDYIGTGGTLYAGNVAKTLILADAQGADPTSFGGVDLVTSLQGLQAPSGRFSDQPDDYSNSIGQALAIIGLGRAGATVSTASVDFLLAQQCSDGGFQTYIGTTPCASDLDTTGFAIQALVGAKGGDDPAVVRALGWLAGQQAANGSFIGADGVSANSTAVAAQAFAATSDDARLAKAQAFLTTLQYDCSFPAALRGGIAKSPPDFAAAKARGAKADVTDTDLRATPQSTMALSGESLLTVEAGDGSRDTAPLTCPTTTPSSTTTSSSTTTRAAASGTTTSPASTATGELAYTGSEIWPLALIALTLLLLGAGAVAGSRRRVGAHA